MNFNLLNFQRLAFIISAFLLWWSTKSYISNKDSYQNTLIGVIEETKQVSRDAVLIKFKGTEEFNVLSEIKTKEKLLKEDSIYKPLFSNKISLYRKDENNDYKLIKIINRK